MKKHFEVLGREIPNRFVSAIGPSHLRIAVINLGFRDRTVLAKVNGSAIET